MLKRPQKSNRTGDFTGKYLVRSLRRKKMEFSLILKIQKISTHKYLDKNIR